MNLEADRIAELEKADNRPLILIVEDSAVQAEMMRRSIDAAGFATKVACNGAQGLSMAISCHPAVVVSDISMPVMDGFELCQEIRLNAALHTLPVILLTSMADTSDVIRGLNAGADGYVTKPYDEKLLIASISQQLVASTVANSDGEPWRMTVNLEGETHVVEPKSQRQLVNLLVSTYESAVLQNRELLRAQDALNVTNSELEKSVDELARAIAELKRTQTQLVQSAKMASLGQLVAGIAHEINNPLAFVLGHQDTVLRALKAIESEGSTVLSTEGARHLHKAVDRLSEMAGGLERIEDLVLKLRTFSRLDEGEYKKINIDESIESVLTLLHYRLGNRIRVKRDFGEVKSLDCMPGPLNQVLLNLIANAIDAIPGEGEIVISTTTDAGIMRIRIADTGQGMSVKTLEHMFEPFFTTKPVGQGTGLGLSISYNIVRKHGGTLEVVSEIGKGSVFTIQIPIHGQSAISEVLR